MKRFVIICFFVLGLLNILDGLNTYIILQHNGSELNPIVNSVIERTNITIGIILSKLFAILLVSLLMFLCWKYYPYRIRKNLLVFGHCFLLSLYIVVVTYSSLLILFVI